MKCRNSTRNPTTIPGSGMVFCLWFGGVSPFPMTIICRETKPPQISSAKDKNLPPVTEKNLGKNFPKVQFGNNCEEIHTLHTHTHTPRSWEVITLIFLIKKVQIQVSILIRAFIFPRCHGFLLYKLPPPLPHFFPPGGCILESRLPFL